MVSDPAVAQRLRHGHAYEIANKAFLANIESDVVRGETIEAFTQSLRTVWYVGIPFAGVGLLVCFLEREIKLRTTLKTEFGLADVKQVNGTGDENGVRMQELTTPSKCKSTTRGSHRRNQTSPSASNSFNELPPLSGVSPGLS